MPFSSHMGHSWTRHRTRFSLLMTALLTVALLGITPATVHAATITVNTTAAGLIAGDGLCSLAEAIFNANQGSAGYPNCAAGSAGADIINMNAIGTYNINVPASGSNPATYIGLPLIYSTITINGNGNTIQRQAGSNFLTRLFYVYAGGQGLGAGNLTLNNLIIQNFVTTDEAYGIVYNESVLTINDSTFISNTGVVGGIGGNAVANRAAGTQTATLTVNRSRFFGNTVTSTYNGYGAGGAINSLAVDQGTANVTITDSLFNGNTATNQGAGISNAAYGNGAVSNMTIFRSSITNNNTTGISSGPNATPAFGGGLINFVNILGARSNLTIVNSTISGNQAQYQGYGGGIFNEADCGFNNPNCGAVALILNHVTIANNSASASNGGGIWSNNNSAGGGGGGTTANILNSIIAGNTAGGDCKDVTNSFIREGYNIASDVSCGFNQFSTALIKLGALDTSGSTYYHPLLGGSAAINKIASNLCGAAQDQLTTVRPQGGACDVGAIESTSLPPKDTVGLYNPQNGAWLLRYLNSNGLPNITFLYGSGGADILPVDGDWDGDGLDTQGIYVKSTGAFILSNTLNGAPNYSFPFGPGNQGFLPVVGDWDGNGTDTVGVYNPANGRWFLINQNASIAPDYVFPYGNGGALVPITGDWDGNGTDGPGLYNPANSAFLLRNLPTSGIPDISFPFGQGTPNLVPLTGDFDGNSTDTIGVYNPATAAFILSNSSTGQTVETPFPYGPANSGLIPLMGVWSANNGNSRVVEPGDQPQIAPTFAP